MEHLWPKNADLSKLEDAFSLGVFSGQCRVMEGRGEKGCLSCLTGEQGDCVVINLKKTAIEERMKFWFRLLRHSFRFSLIQMEKVPTGAAVHVALLCSECDDPRAFVLHRSGEHDNNH